MALELFNKDIIFAFIDVTDKDGFFKDKTEWGFEMHQQDNLESSKSGRWAKVVACGPDCDEVVNGSVVFIEPLMWTSRFEFDDVRLWKTDESKLMLIDDNFPTKHNPTPQ